MNEPINEQIQNYINEVLKAAKEADVKDMTEVKFTITAEFTWKKDIEATLRPTA